MTAARRADVLIAGGGLAGLTLARQLRDARSDLDIVVLEKNRFPVPEAVAKVGESTVEIGSHYLKQTVGLGEHFEAAQLRKFGLRCFFGHGASDFSQKDELGVSETFGIPTYQIDRGRLENHLWRELAADGVTILDGAETREIDIDGKTRRITADHDGGALTLEAPWIIDTAGRRCLLRNQLGLGRASEHRGNALWFRLDRDIRIDQWSGDSGWRERCKPSGQRWLSTNHLMGPGYWIWIIPLASGITSIGMVCDDQALADSGIRGRDDVLPFVEIHHPELADAMAGAGFLDFHLVKDYAYESSQVFSADGWALCGESGMFSDPFYSPGSDFIAIGNTLTTRLVGDDFRGRDIRLAAAVYDRVYRSIFRNTLSLYRGTYGGFGDRRMMGLKLLWDYAYYWGVLSLLFYRDLLPDIERMQTLTPVLKRAEALHHGVQDRFRQRATERRVYPARGLFLDQFRIPCLQGYNTVLKGGGDTDTARQLGEHVSQLERIAGYIGDMLSDTPAATASDDETSLLGDYRRSVMAA